MKFRNLIAIAAFSLFAACETTYRATDSGLVVPEETQVAFSTQYPNATSVYWSNYDPQVIVLNDWELAGWPTMETNDYVVTFNMDNEKYYAWYDTDGTWIGSAYVVKDYTVLPSAVNTTLSTEFPGYSISSVNRTFQKDRVAYEIVLKKDDTRVVALVDNEGKIIKQKTRLP